MCVVTTITVCKKCEIGWNWQVERLLSSNWPAPLPAKIYRLFPLFLSTVVLIRPIGSSSAWQLCLGSEIVLGAFQCRSVQEIPNSIGCQRYACYACLETLYYWLLLLLLFYSSCIRLRYEPKRIFVYGRGGGVSQLSNSRFYSSSRSEAMG